MDLAGFRNAVYLRVVAPLVAVSPAWLAYGLALVYADTRRSLDRARYREVSLCLEHVMGGRMSSRALEETARDYFRNRACIRVDAMRLVGDGHNLTRLVTFHGEESIREALASGKGAVLCSAHYGSVRACGALLGARGFPVTMITAWSLGEYRPKGMRRQRMYQFAWKPLEHHMRKPLDIRVARIGIAVAASGILRRDELVFTLLDTAAPHGNQNAVTLDLLGGKTRVLPGPAVIAQLSGAPLFMVFLHRAESWRHLVLEIGPRIGVSGDTTSAIRECMSEVERRVEQRPSEWEMWTMRRLFHIGLFPEDLAAEYYRMTNRRWGTPVTRG